MCSRKCGELLLAFLQLLLVEQVRLRMTTPTNAKRCVRKKSNTQMCTQRVKSSHGTGEQQALSGPRPIQALAPCGPHFTLC